jgi:hypothetical protein
VACGDVTVKDGYVVLEVGGAVRESFEIALDCRGIVAATE